MPVRRVKWNLRSSTRASSCVVQDGNWCSDAKASKDKGYISMVATESFPGSPAPSSILHKISDRKLIEFCCSNNSVLGREKYLFTGCEVQRLTIDNDLTTKGGLKHALDAVENTKPGQYIHLWGALPCTGGSPWQHVNKKHESARSKIDAHLTTFAKLIRNFIIVTRNVIERGGDVSFEWPTGCSLWKTGVIQEMLTEFSLNSVHFHGCAAGLK